jgi:hypothetical protein
VHVLVAIALGIPYIGFWLLSIKECAPSARAIMLLPFWFLLFGFFTDRGKRNCYWALAIAVSFVAYFFTFIL